MTAIVMDGDALAAQILADLATRSAAMAETGRPPGLGTVLVGDDPPSTRYVAGKHRDCAAVGMASIGMNLPATATQAEVEAAVDEMNANPDVDAYIVQYPLPKGLDFERVMLRVDPAKDADGLHPVNLGWLAMGRSGPVACTPQGILRMLMHYEVPVEGKELVVIGRGLTIGRPLALLMALKRVGANAAVTVVHSGVPNLADYVRRADIVVSAAGSPGLVTPDMVKPGAAVVGAGVTMDGRRVIPDVDESVADVAGWITPRLGGVGPMTRAMLLSNTVDAAAARRGSSPTHTSRAE